MVKLQFQVLLLESVTVIAATLNPSAETTNKSAPVEFNEQALENPAAPPVRPQLFEEIRVQAKHWEGKKKSKKKYNFFILLF